MTREDLKKLVSEGELEYHPQKRVPAVKKGEKPFEKIKATRKAELAEIVEEAKR